MSLARMIAYTIHQLSENQIAPYKTFIHKLIYLSIPEQREELYRPYFYGPYSDQVQNTLLSLLKNSYISVADGKKGYSVNRQTFEQRHIVADTLLDKSCIEKKRIDATINFLKSGGFTSVESISNLAKIHFIAIRNPIDTSNEFSEYIRHIGKYLGWPTIEKWKMTKYNESTAMQRILNDCWGKKCSSMVRDHG